MGETEKGSKIPEDKTHAFDANAYRYISVFFITAGALMFKYPRIFRFFCNDPSGSLDGINKTLSLNMAFWGFIALFYFFGGSTNPPSRDPEPTENSADSPCASENAASKSLTNMQLIRLAWERVFAASPLFLPQGVLPNGLLVGGASVLFLILVISLGNVRSGMHLSAFRLSSFEGVFQNETLAILGVLLAFVLLWALLLGPFVKGCTYGRLWDQAKEGRFSNNGLLSDGRKNYPRLFDFHLVVIGTGMFLAGVSMVLYMGGIWLAAAGHVTTVCLAACGFVLLGIAPSAILLGSYGYFVMGYLTQGHAFWDSFDRGWRVMTSANWRGFKLMGVAMVGLGAAGLVLLVLGVIGTVLLWLFGAVYLPALSIAYVQEIERSPLD